MYITCYISLYNSVLIVLIIVLIKLQFKEIDLITRQEDNIEIRSKMLSLTPQVCKRLGINKSTLWYMQKQIRKGKRIKVYGKVMGK